MLSCTRGEGVKLLKVGKYNNENEVDKHFV